MDSRPLTDLVVRARAGDRQAFDELVALYHPLALREAWGMVADADIARDLAQEALLQAYLSLARLREEERFGSWLCGIVRNVCRSYLRDRKAEWLSLETLTGGVQLDARSAGAAGDPQQAAEARERVLSARAALAALAPRDREVARCFYERQLSLQEIAALTGLTVPGVKNRLYRARKQLRERLSRVYPELLSAEIRGGRKAMVRVTVSGVYEDERTAGRLATVALVDETGQRSLHIGMSPADAAALAAGLRPHAMPLPLTAGFMAGLLEATGGKLDEVRIEALKQGVFVAVAKLRRGKTVREIQARPSDALALAVQTGSPIYVAEAVMGQAGFDFPMSGSAEEAPIPERLPVIPIRDAVFFPRSIAPLFVGRDKSVRALEEAEAAGRHLLLLAQKETALDDPRPEDIYTVGIAARLMDVLRLPDGTVRVLIEGKTRARVRTYLQTEPFHQADVELLPEVEAEAAGSEALIERLLASYQELAQQGRLAAFAPGADWAKHQGPGQVADALTSYLPLPVETKQAILETADPRQRLEKLSAALD